MNQPFDTKCAQLDDLLGVGRSFDMVSRELYVGGRRAKIWVVNGYARICSWAGRGKAAGGRDTGWYLRRR